jgi:hypothetical protein
MCREDSLPILQNKRDCGLTQQIAQFGQLAHMVVIATVDDASGKLGQRFNVKLSRDQFSKKTNKLTAASLGGRLKRQ